MPKAIRYRHGGNYLRNTLFWSQYDYIGAYHAQPEVFDAALAAEEEALTIASHKRDFATAFGVPEDEIAIDVIPWDGAIETLPFDADNAAPIERIPTAPAPPPPDAPAFKLAAYAYLGASAFVAPLSGYIAPTLDALNAGNWALARQIIGFARQAQALTAEQYADIVALMAEHGIPEA